MAGSNIPDTASRKTRRRRTKAIAKRYVFHVNARRRRTGNCKAFCVSRKRNNFVERLESDLKVDWSFACQLGESTLSNLILKTVKAFRKFCGIPLCKWESCNIFWNLFQRIATNSNTLWKLFLRIGAKFTKLNSAKNIDAKINYLQVTLVTQSSNLDAPEFLKCSCCTRMSLFQGPVLNLRMRIFCRFILIGQNFDIIAVFLQQRYNHQLFRVAVCFFGSMELGQ